MSGRRGRRIGLALTTWTLVAGHVLPTVWSTPSPLFAQSTSAAFQSPSETLQLNATSASTWSQGRTSVVQLDGPVSIRLDRQTLTADRAVVWLTPANAILPNQQDAEIVLLGNAEIVSTDTQSTRSGPRLLVSATVRGAIRITAARRAARDLSNGETYQDALALRPITVDQLEETPAVVPGVPAGVSGAVPGAPTGVSGVPSSPAGFPSTPLTTSTTTRPWRQPAPARVAPAPTTQQVFVAPPEPVQFRADTVQTTQTSDDKVALVLSGGVTVFQRRANGDLIELLADRAVLYTPLNNLRELQEEGATFTTVEDAITAGYLEGDVRISFTPGATTGAEQRLRAKRVYYEFSSDRAILTDAVIHTNDQLIPVPMILRADTIRQLALGEWRTKNAKLTTSSFATPSYAVAADRAYVRQVDTGDERFGTRTNFFANSVRFDTFGLPIFWLPVAAGSVTERGFPLRQIGFGNSTRFGFETTTEWGLFETLGRLPPPGLDASFRLDYFTDRGPATGLNADYQGGFITETTRDPWNFDGQIRTYFVLDKGEDDLGSSRLKVEPEQDLRGQAIWQHQHFLPDNWQVQLRAGWLSDPTFREQWFKDDFDNDLPVETSLYLKRQENTEALTFLATAQPNDFVTSADNLQENFEVERLPEIGYRRIGDSLFNDRFTFFSTNTLGGLRFNESDATPADLGFLPPFVEPGLPSRGLTGVSNDYVVRGDTRQEIDYPVQLGRFKVVPYVIGRYTGYADSPEGGNKNRLYAGTGVRINTAFWRVDDTAVSHLFDIHRIRHVVEPEVHLYTSASTLDRSEIYDYDEVDSINDITAGQVALRQRWQTKRGGPGRWRSVDFFTLNVEGNFFANQPDDALIAPTNFRSLFFSSEPERSIPRNGINTDASWRVADTTILLGDLTYNLDESQVATAAVGVAVQRDARTSYYVGTRYIEELSSNIATIAVTYQLSRKYTLGFSQSYDFSDSQNVASVFNVQRRFDRFFATVSVYHDDNSDESGLRFNLFPEGLGAQAGTGSLENLFSTPR